MTGQNRFSQNLFPPYSMIRLHVVYTAENFLHHQSAPLPLRDIIILLQFFSVPRAARIFLYHSYPETRSGVDLLSFVFDFRGSQNSLKNQCISRLKEKGCEIFKTIFCDAKDTQFILKQDVGRFPFNNWEFFFCCCWQHNCYQELGWLQQGIR